jgi:tetratricopeptide (TPR) repeat protein
MSYRIVAASTLVALLGTAAFADVIVVKSKGKERPLGLPSKVGPEGNEIDVTVENWRRFEQESTGLIDRDGYDGIEFRENAKKKAEFFPRADIVDYSFTTEPDAMLEGIDRMATGNYAQALGAFQEVLQDAEAREAFKVEARFKIGICYVAAGNTAKAISHFSAWPDVNSIYTPHVHRILAEIHTERNAFDKARESYAKIGGLGGATEEMKLLSQLGGVRVDIAERKFDEAEAAAKRIASGAGSLANVRAFAVALQGEAILRSGKKERLPEAQSALEAATANLDGVDESRRAHLFSTLGDVLYAQGKLEDARFPYARVFCLYTDEPAFVASSLQNCGQCFLDLSGRAKDQAEKDALLIKGMRLLGECAGRYRGTGSAREAAKTHRANKAAYDEARRRAGEVVAEEGAEAEKK